MRCCAPVPSRFAAPRRFVFSMFDRDRSGYIDEDEFAGMVHALHNSEPMFPGNFKDALQEFDCEEDGRMGYGAFKALARRFPMTIYPAMRLQSSLHRCFLGTTKWERLRERRDLRKRLLAYRKENEGAMPPLGCWENFTGCNAYTTMRSFGGLRNACLPKRLPGCHFFRAYHYFLCCYFFFGHHEIKMVP